MFIVKIYLLNENYNSTILTVRSSIHDILLRIVFNLQLIVVVSYCQPTKHRVTLFHYVVSSFSQTALPRQCFGMKTMQNYEKESKPLSD